MGFALLVLGVAIEMSGAWVTLMATYTKAETPHPLWGAGTTADRSGEGY